MKSSSRQLSRYRSALASVCLGLAFLAPSILAGSIFDDDWVPPKPSVPAPPPTPSTVSPPPATTVPVEPPPVTPAPDSVTPPAQPADATVQPPAAAGRRPVPPAADRAHARKTFKEVFARELADRTPAARRALSTRLLSEAANDAIPAEQFVLMIGAAEAGEDGQELGLCTRAADALAAEFDVDGLQLKSSFAMKSILRGATPAATEENCRDGLDIVDQLIAADNIADAGRLLAALKAAAADDPATAHLVQRKSTDVEAIRTGETRIASQLEKLKTAPADAAANSAVGEFYCLVKGDWARGLPMLARGADAALRALATQDMASPAEADAQAASGDGWWNYSTKLTGIPKSRAVERAGKWYTAADDRLSGLNKVRVENRLKEMQTIVQERVKPVDLLHSMKETGKVKTVGTMVDLLKGAKIVTPSSFRPPLTINLVVMTDEKDFRIGYAANQIIFNWEGNRDELRVDGGPVNGHHKQGAGRLPARAWTTIQLAVTNDAMAISVDGTERYRASGDFSKVDQPFSAVAHNGDVAIKSITMQPGATR